MFVYPRGKDHRPVAGKPGNHGRRDDVMRRLVFTEKRDGSVDGISPKLVILLEKMTIGHGILGHRPKNLWIDDQGRQVTLLAIAHGNI